MAQGFSHKSGRLTTGEAARRLGVSPQTIRNRVMEGKIRGDKEEDPTTGKFRYYIPYKEIEAEVERDITPATMEDLLRVYTESVTDSLDSLVDGQTQIIEQLSSVAGALERSVELQKAVLKKLGLAALLS